MRFVVCEIRDFLHLSAHAGLVEELIDDTMVEVWQKAASIGASASVSVTIMRLAYSHRHKRLAENRLKIWRREAVQRLICDTDGLTEDVGCEPSDRHDQRARRG
jgi:hypothetical protein